MRVSPYNLKKYLGIPQISFEQLSSLHAYNDGHWLDHCRMAKACKETGGFSGETVMFISEPYGVGLRGLRDIVSLCEHFNLGVIVDGQSKHNPGACCRIMLWRENAAETR